MEQSLCSAREKHRRCFFRLIVSITEMLPKRGMIRSSSDFVSNSEETSTVQLIRELKANTAGKSVGGFYCVMYVKDLFNGE
jgi:hypothetical protein